MRKLLALLFVLSTGTQAKAFDLASVHSQQVTASAQEIPAVPAAKQAYTGGLPLGDLFGPLPPYFHGQMPQLQVEGQAAEGVYEYTNKIIFYKDKAEALAAAEKAAVVIRAAGGEVLAYKAEALDGFYYTSVAYTGKNAILYRWDDDAPGAEEATAVMERKIRRYRSEGYSILETRVTQTGNKHFFFIICAKFY